MKSYVRYSVAVYLGLLLAGVLVGPMPQPSNGSPATRGEATRLRQVAHPTPAPPVQRVQICAPRADDERSADASGTLLP